MHRYLFPLSLLLVVLLLSACSPSPEEPDPLELYYPAFNAEELPEDFDASVLPRYDINMRVDPAVRKIDGVARIHFTNRSDRPLNDLFVRLYPNLRQLEGVMRLTSIVTLPDRFATGMGSMLDDTAARITLTESLPVDESIDLEIVYSVEALKQEGYVLFGESEGILSLPYSYPMLAAQTGDPANPWRLEIPPQHGDIAITDLALHTITVTLPSDIVIAATGTELTRTETSPGWTEHVFVTGPVREWAMIMSPDYLVESGEVDGIRLNSYYLPQDEVAGRAAYKEAAAALRAYNRMFAPYPYTELDIAEAPTRHLGMEYPGLNYIGIVTYRDKSYSQEQLVAHEVSHQWWYALVGSEPFRYPWLDEGLAEHTSLLYLEYFRGENTADRLRTIWKTSADWAAANGYDNVVGQEVTAFNGINYEILVYGKSAMFFDALYKQLGHDDYLEVLQTFIKLYRFKNPTPQDFLDTVKDVSGFDASALYQQWILTAVPTPTPEPSPEPTPQAGAP
ncbi:MAG TPA: M1 family metallopeptidase [Caldilineae bacterium]|nr:M1 family metallopeptidase [Caldilineae bacterium]